MNECCFVPMCNNTTGVPFPRDANLKKEWVESLKIKKLVPQNGSFVCLDHFKETDLKTDVPAGTRPSNKIKKGAVPCIPNPKKHKRNGKPEDNNEPTVNTSPKLKLEPIVKIEQMKRAKEQANSAEQSDTAQEKIPPQSESSKPSKTKNQNIAEELQCASQTSTQSSEENLDDKSENTDENENTDKNSEQKRGRGRPRKISETVKNSDPNTEQKRARGRPRKTSETVTEPRCRSRSSMRIRALEEKNANAEKRREDVTSTETKAVEINTVHELKDTENLHAEKKIETGENKKVEEQNILNGTKSSENAQSSNETIRKSLDRRPRGRSRKRSGQPLNFIKVQKNETVKKPDIIELALLNLENEEPLQREKKEIQIINETASTNARHDVLVIETEIKDALSPPKQSQSNEKTEESPAAKLIKLRYKPTTGVHNVHSTITEKSQEAQTVFNTENQSRICRTCMSDKNVTKHILEYIEDEITVMSTLMLCAFPLEISKNDELPKFICKQCFIELQIAHKFRLKCLRSEDILLRRFSQNKRKIDHDHVESSSKKLCLEQTHEKPQETQEKLEQTQEKIEQTEENLAKPEHIDDIDKTSEDDIEDFDSSNFTEEDTSAGTVIDMSEIEKSLKEMHGNEEEKIAIVENSEIKQVQTLENILDALEDGCSQETIKPPKSPKQRFVIKKVTKKSPSAAEPNVKRVVTEQQPVYTSEIGTFRITENFCFYSYIFCMINGYVYEYGLCKNGIRALKCILSTCDSVAEQKQLETDFFDEMVEVTVPHNHPKECDVNRQKQVFFSIIKKRIQNDKMVNIRNLYQDICSQEPHIKNLLSLRNVISEVCKHQLYQNDPVVTSFEDFYHNIETDRFEKLHFTTNYTQFYQNKFETEDGAMAIVFANGDVINNVSDSKLMYVDASFKIETNENFSYQLVTVLVWVEDSYYPILFAFINRKTQALFKLIFQYLHDTLAPNLHPYEIVTDYEANIYYALGETYVDSHIGGSVFYYTQNLYKKICSLNLSKDLETNSYFRNIYHMLLMLPLLPVNTILDGLNNIEIQAKDLGLIDLARPILDHIRTQWIINVTPDLFCVHRLENRINENVIAPFKKLRDFLLLTKGKMQKTQINIVVIVQKLLELDDFLQSVYAKPDKKSFGRDLSSYQKKNVLRAWQYIENHPKININNFFSKVLGYIKCMENQLWIWGFYRFEGEVDDVMIQASDFSIVSSNSSEEAAEEIEQTEFIEYTDPADNTVIVEAVVEHDGEVVLQNNDNVMTTQVPTIPQGKHFESAFLKYVYQE